MNIIFIKQAIKVKVNKRDTERALKEALESVFDTTLDNIETAVFNTNSINGIEAGASIIVASTKDLEKYAILSLGASTKDIWCITDNKEDMSRIADNGKETTYCFEYIMTVDKKVFNGIHVKDTLKEIETNGKLYEAIKIVGIVANTARYDTLISGRYGQAMGTTSNIYSGLSVVDCLDKDSNDINVSMVGRKGRLHLLRIAPLLKDEFEVVKYIDDFTMTELVSLAMIRDNKGDFSDRTDKFNFSPVLPVETLSKDDIKQLGLEVDNNGKPIITTACQVRDFMDMKY